MELISRILCLIKEAEIESGPCVALASCLSVGNICQERKLRLCYSFCVKVLDQSNDHFFLVWHRLWSK